ncbi:MAG: hypothetical protein HRT57_00160 [Crocinitomicaceae bacterium]|nr:hypothetical protein [Crocinitomicaceae bacterium]
MQATLKPTLIDKENISTLNFRTKTSIQQHPQLMQQIKKATRLGNGYRGKVLIYFEDDNGLKCVSTTIWAHGVKYICLKGGVWIPIRRIVEIKSFHM